MGLLSQSRDCLGSAAFLAAAWAGLGCVAARAALPAAAWDKAVEARARFEAEPAHTRAAYTRVLDGFRAIYHADPAAAHAARAVEQVAELLAEQGREFNDPKSLRDAAGQYEFLAKAYPGSGRSGERAEHALLTAAALLAPEAANDPAELKKVRAQLAATYPRAARELAATAPQKPEPPLRRATALPGDPAIRHPAIAADAQQAKQDHREAATRPAPALRETPSLTAATPVSAEKTTGPSAVVTGIRHWSTASYTRVAIDLDVQGGGDAVRYEAARVEDPDRIFFDLHHARLAPQLAGKSFSVTDGGFLTRMRAAQFSDEVTRVVLDVHQVAEYSAFLLPNPTRLIIDIHDRQAPASRTQSSEEAIFSPIPEPAPAPAISRASTPSTTQPVEVSSLPPMPVTDGSASFGLPPRNDAAQPSAHTQTQTAAEPTAPPRVVIPSRPTLTRPVPNAVARNSVDTGSEVAAVSLQPGKVEATSHPTARPVSSGSRAQRPAPGAGPTLPAANPRSAARVAATPAEAAPPTADGETLVRALGLKIGRIVIDAGHGGHDSGTLGAGGIQEKDVVLDVALRLGKLLHDRLGAEIVYTRADDTFIPLETRTAIANKAQADLFISVHANSSQDPSARGVEVYYLNFTSDPEAMQVASRENAVSTQSVHELSDLVKKIALKDKIDESKELATDVDASLFAGLTKGNPGLKDRGVKKAPFVVLIGANMPSILAEISFVTNPDDANQLQQPDYRQRVAESLYGGVSRYAEAINGPAPVKLAAARTRTTERAAAK
jgi:N-acetylmuramoyl-L-alanine amidase